MSEFVIEQGIPLSKSFIWELQRSYYLETGPAAWSQGVVPHYISSNPYMAESYAKIIFAFMRDLKRQQDRPANKTLYIVELGAGSGRFSFYMLQRLLALYQHSTVQDVKFKYVMTDLSMKNIAFWKTHEKLKPYVESGLLDFALFDMQKDEEMKLELSGEYLSHQQTAHSIVVLANYVLDSIPQDVFYVQEDQLYEALIQVIAPQEDVDFHDPALLSQLNYSFQTRLLDKPLDYYADKQINPLLTYYQEQLHQSFVTIPMVAIQCIERLQRLTHGDFLLLSADKGSVLERSLHDKPLPYIVNHGSISMAVNYHALGHYFLAGNGEFLTTEQENQYIAVVGLLKGTGDYVETKMAYRSAIDKFGPDDYYLLRQGIKPHYEAMDARQLLAYIRWTSWDAKTYLDIHPFLITKITTEVNFPTHEWYCAALLIWEHYFPIGEDAHISLSIGLLVYMLNYDNEAIYFFEIAFEHFGFQSLIYYYIGCCYYYLDQLQEAKSYVTQALSLEPNHEDSKLLLASIEASAIKS